MAAARQVFAEVLKSSAELIKARGLETGRAEARQENTKRLQRRSVLASDQFEHCLSALERKLFETICQSARWLKPRAFVADPLVFDLVYSWCLRCP